MTSSPVPDPPGQQTYLLDEPFTERDLQVLRRTVAAHADRTTLPASRVSDLVLIVAELAANAVRHGGGSGRLRVWSTGEVLYCEVTDGGPGLSLPYPLPDQRPEPSVTSGRGLWLVVNYADDITIGTGTDGGGTVVTATLRLPGTN
jgi:anti-sigma regulatory factor (Ser/Thr protein kinase)